MKNYRIISFSMLLLVTMLACSTVSNIVATPTPVPTNTPLPSPTPVPSATPASVLFEDSEFTNSCITTSTTDVERFVENGQFNMRVITPSFVSWTECTKVEYKDFVVEVDASQVSGPDNNTYGIIFRYGLDTNEFYTFSISGDGYYVLAIDGADREGPEMIVDWTQSSAIKQGVQTNHLKVVAIGENIQYYVNDQLLGETQNSNLSTGTIGFFAGALDEGNVLVSFDNLKISNP
jgi:hypothetical protein